MVGTILSRASTTVTFEPNLLHTDPISNPIYPPPITRSDFGILDRERAPVEDTIFFSSTGIFGISIEDDPVAIIKFLALAVILFFPFVIEIVFLSTNEAIPGICVILFFLNKKPIPVVSFFTILVLRSIKTFRSKSIFDVFMPCSAA